MTEVQYRGFVWQNIGYSAESRKPPHALDLIQGIFHLPARQIQPILHTVDAKHAPHRHRLDGSAVQPWDNAAQCVPAKLATVLPLISLKKTSRRIRRLL